MRRRFYRFLSGLTAENCDVRQIKPGGVPHICPDLPIQTGGGDFPAGDLHHLRHEVERRYRNIGVLPGAFQRHIAGAAGQVQIAV